MYRDDHEALLYRMAELERELESEVENRRAREEELERLRSEVKLLRRFVHRGFSTTPMVSATLPFGITAACVILGGMFLGLASARGPRWEARPMGSPRLAEHVVLQEGSVPEVSFEFSPLLPIVIPQSGPLLVGDRTAEESELAGAVSGAVERDPEVRAVLTLQRAAAPERVVSVVRELRAAGVMRFSVLNDAP